jgi:hypothetical protein
MSRSAWYRRRKAGGSDLRQSIPSR